MKGKLRRSLYEKSSGWGKATVAHSEHIDPSSVTLTSSGGTGNLRRAESRLPGGLAADSQSQYLKRAMSRLPGDPNAHKGATGLGTVTRGVDESVLKTKQHG